MQLSEAIYSRNIFYLKQVAVSSEGLVSAEIRKAAWPLLLHAQKEDWRVEDSSNHYSDLIEKDIERSLFGMDITDLYSEEEREDKRKELSIIINSVIKKNPELHYSQGYNQICTVFYVTAGLDIGFILSQKCAKDMLRDCMRRSFEDGLIQQLHLIYQVLEAADILATRKLQALYSYDSEVDIPTIAVPWIICWFSSCLNKYKDIARIFDFCLATHALAPVYLSVVVILSKKSELLECEDNSELHTLYKNLDDINVEKLCKDAFDLMMKVSPLEISLKNKNKFKGE